jgi:nucleotide-binding universal stress UspA family protein
VAADRIHTHVLPAAGGASGVGESLVELARARGFGLVALGSRGLGGFQRTLQSLLGLGSVSDYVLHNVEAPVLVVRPTAAAHAGAGKVRALPRGVGACWCCS